MLQFDKHCNLEIPANESEPLHYRAISKCKNNSFKVNKGTFSASMKLRGNAWNAKIDKVIHTDASFER